MGTDTALPPPHAPFSRPYRPGRCDGSQERRFFLSLPFGPPLQLRGGSTRIYEVPPPCFLFQLPCGSLLSSVPLSLVTYGSEARSGPCETPVTIGNEWFTVVPVPFTHTHRSSQFLAESISAEMQVPVIVYDKKCVDEPKFKICRTMYVYYQFLKRNLRAGHTLLGLLSSLCNQSLLWAWTLGWLLHLIRVPSCKSDLQHLKVRCYSNNKEWELCEKVMTNKGMWRLEPNNELSGSRKFCNVCLRSPELCTTWSIYILHFRSLVQILDQTCVLVRNLPTTPF